MGGPKWTDVITQYRNTAQQLSGGHAWLLMVERLANDPVRDPSREAQELLGKLDSIVQMMPSEEYSKLKGKISDIIVSANTWRESYDTQLRDLLVEVLAWAWLHRRYPSDRVQFNKTPDLLVLASNSTVVAAMECKKFNLSQNEQLFLKSGPVVSSAKPLARPSLGWFKKLLKDIHKAKKQLLAVQSARDRFIFISFSHDIDIQGARMAHMILPGVVLPAGDPYQAAINFIAKIATRLNGEGIKLIWFEGFDV